MEEPVAQVVITLSKEGAVGVHTSGPAASPITMLGMMDLAKNAIIRSLEAPKSPLTLPHLIIGDGHPRG